MKWTLVFLCLVILFACGDDKPADPLARAWVFSTSPGLDPDVSDLLDRRGTWIADLTNDAYLDLQTDGTYTYNLGKLGQGRWPRKGDVLELTDNNNVRRFFEIRSLDKKRLLCVNTYTKNIFLFRGFQNNFKDSSDNPFAISNNQWRIQPTHRESDEEINMRLKNHFRYLEKIYGWILSKKLRTLDMSRTPTMVESYANGFSLMYYEHTSKAWKDCFYDTLDCYKAYERLHYTMYYKKVEWPDTKKPAEMLQSAYRQVQGWMDEHPQRFVPDKPDTLKSRAK